MRNTKKINKINGSEGEKIRIPLSPRSLQKAPKTGAFTFFQYHLRQLFDAFAPMFAKDLQMNESKIKYPHKLGKLVDHGGDMSKRWYVEFYVWSRAKKKLIRRRWYQKFDQFTTYKERRAYGLEMVKDLNRVLPYSFAESPAEKLERNQTAQEQKKIKPSVKHVSMISQLNSVLDNLYDPAKKTAKDYKSALKEFSTWLPTYCFEGIDFKNFRRSDAQAFVDYLFHTTKKSGKTVENIIARMKVMTNKLVERSVIEVNPFLKLSMPKVVQTDKNTCFSNDQIVMIKKHCKKHDPFMWLVCQFIYYTYMRPVEIGRLKIKHLDFAQSKIHVSGDISKNAKSQTIEMPEPLKKELLKYVKNAPADYFVFTADQKPGKSEIADSYFGKHFMQIRRDLKIDERHTLYSWKHTGVVAAYKNGVDIKAIQLQCRHHSIEQTDTYLKSLGFMKNDAYTSGIKKI